MAKPLHIPLADVMNLAGVLQFAPDSGYGKTVSAKQIEKAERIIRRLIREHLAGK